MPTVRFLDGPRRGTSVDVPAQRVPAEGRYWLRDGELTAEGSGTPYYLKLVDQAHSSWTAALDPEDRDLTP